MSGPSSVYESPENPENTRNIEYIFRVYFSLLKNNLKPIFLASSSEMFGNVKQDL